MITIVTHVFMGHKRKIIVNMVILKFRIVRVSERILKVWRGIDMVYYSDECCGCATETYPCLGSSCPRRHVLHMECDKCHDDELCADCALEELEKVRVD